MDKFDEVLDSLIRRLFTPDLQLDNELWNLFGFAQADPDAPFRGERLEGGIDPCEIISGRDMKTALALFPDDVRGINRSWNVPRLTQDISAALSIIPAHSSYSMGGPNPAWAEIDGQRAHAVNIAIALCLAHTLNVHKAIKSM